MAVRGAVRGRALRRAIRQRGAVVHRPHRHHGDQDAARPFLRSRLAVARGHGCRGAVRAPGGDGDALSHRQSSHRRAVHRPGALAVALARGAAELGLLSERFRRAHFQPRDADRSLGALDADRDHHHGLVHYGLWQFGHSADRHGGPLAGAADRAVVLRLCGAAVLFRAAHARALESQFHRPLDADGPHRRQLHQHPHREAVRARQRRRSICAQRGRRPCRSVLGVAAAPHRVRRDARHAQCAVDRRIGRAGARCCGATAKFRSAPSPWCCR